MERKWCVYKHTTPSGKMYVGVTSQKPSRRWNNGNGYSRNKYFSRAIYKYGWDNITHEILASDLTKEEASLMERDLINDLDLTNPYKGYNLESGGYYGYELNDLSKHKMSESKKGKYVGNKNPMYGKKHTDESKRKMSEALKGRVITDEWRKHISEKMSGEGNPMYGVPSPMKGKKFTQEHRNKISAALSGRKLSEETKRKLSQSKIGKTVKAVMMINPITHDLIRIYPSITKASEDINISACCISNCCAGRSKTAGGYVWKYKEDIKNKY
jgi:group I intron endonuclease